MSLVRISENVTLRTGLPKSVWRSLSREGEVPSLAHNQTSVGAIPTPAPKTGIIGMVLRKEFYD